MSKQRRGGSVATGIAAAERKDYATALRIWRPLAEKGDPEAQYAIGVAYNKGAGVPRDHREAVKWYRLAAKQGDVWAMYNLACHFDRGEGVPQNLKMAMRWYRKAARQGHVEAQVMLAMMYDEGIPGPQDFAQAAKWYRLAAEQGDPRAYMGLGTLYHNGTGVPKDHVRAFMCFSLAVNNVTGRMLRKQAIASRDAVAAELTPDQISEAHCDLGHRCENGLGVPQDDAEAAKWYRKAAKQGHAPAQTMLGCCYEEGTGVVQDDAQAARWYRKAARQGYAVAYRFLAGMFFAGNGLSQDHVQAYMWASLAVANATDRAERKAAVGLLRVIAAEMSPAQVAKATHLAQAWQPEGDTRIAKGIREQGWFCLSVAPDDASDEIFAYTIGFSETFDAPEIAVFGLPAEKAYPLLAECEQLLRRGKRFKPGVKYAKVLAGDYKVIFKPVNEEFVGEYFGRAVRYYGERPFAAMVMFLPDRKHLLPWQKRYEGSMQKKALRIV